MSTKVLISIGNDVAAFLSTVGNKSDYVDRAIRYSFLYATVDEQIWKQTIGAMHQLVHASKNSDKQWEEKVKSGQATNTGGD